MTAAASPTIGQAAAAAVSATELAAARALKLARLAACESNKCCAADRACCSGPCCPGTPARARPVDFRSEAKIVTEKRQDHLSWDDYFFAVAVLSSKRSKDPHLPMGACLVDAGQRVVGIGYNGFPRGCSDDLLPWATESDREWLHTQAPYLVHAVTNAILNKCSDSVAGCRLYVMRFPCNECAKVIIQSDISEVIVLQASNGDSSHNSSTCGLVGREDSAEIQASRNMLQMAGVKLRCVRPKKSSVLLNFLTGLAPSSTDGNSESSVDTNADQSSNQTPEVSADILNLLAHEAKGFDPTNHAINTAKKRSDFISWDDYFMGMAFLAAQRSKDPNTQVGACIVNYEEKLILGLGYNGFPRGCPDDELPWAKGNEDPLHNKYLYVCHAEVNAILNKCSANVKGATLFVAMFPCENCAKMIIQSGIREVVYMSNPYADTDGCRASRIMFAMNGIKLRQHIPSKQRLRLNLVAKVSVVKPGE